MDLLLLQPRQGLRQPARHGGRQPGGAAAGGLHGQGGQHDGPVHQQGQNSPGGVLSQEKQTEEPGPEHAPSSGQDLQ